MGMMGCPSAVQSISHFGKAVSYQGLDPIEEVRFLGARVRSVGAARVRLWRGDDADEVDGTRKLLGEVVLGAAGVATIEAVPGGGTLEANNDGIFVEVVSGTVDVTLLVVEG